jgi:predicted SAM-dependent methyltransferase
MQLELSMPDYKGLHLACFDRPLEGWLNTDISAHIYIARIPGAAELVFRAGKMTKQRRDQHRQGIFRTVQYLDVTKRFPYADNSFGAVFSSHMLEHLPPEQGKFCLMESYRVLQPGGVCRTSVPDLDKIVAAYSPENANAWLTKVYFDGDTRAKNRHHWYYNAISMIQLLHSIGFREAYQCEYQQGRCPDLNHLDNRPSESLFVEAVK